MIKDVLELFYDVVSVTVDMGVEKNVTLCKNIIGYFATSLGIKVAEAMMRYELLMPYALHVYDWHHLLSGALNNACMAWPQVAARRGSPASTFSPQGLPAEEVLRRAYVPRRRG